MISALRGQLLLQNADALVIDVQGVGYEVAVTSSVLAAVSAQPTGTELSLFVHTDVKENSISLFGFAGLTEKEVFLLLKKVKGIGSKTALAVISAMGAEKVLSAIGREDLTNLQKVPGIGKKTAERMILELREQVQLMVPGGPLKSNSSRRVGNHPSPILQSIANGQSNPAEDAAQALERLGFRAEEAWNAVRCAVETCEPSATQDAGEILRHALANL